MGENVSLFLDFEEYYLFLDESGSPEISDLSNSLFLICCVKIEKNYYDNYFRKKVLKFKKKHKIQTSILHSADIRKSRKSFEFLLNPTKRGLFLGDLSGLIQELKFEIYYFSVDKKDMINRPEDFYWLAMKEVFRMIKNDLEHTNQIAQVFCESRNNHQNQTVVENYNFYYKLLENSMKFKKCFPPKVDFRTKEPNVYEISGLEITDLVAFPIMNLVRNKVNNTKANIKLYENYKVIEEKIRKNYHYKIHQKYKKPHEES